MRKGFQIVVVVALVMVMCGSSFTVAQAGFFDQFTKSKDASANIADGKFDESDMTVTVNGQEVKMGIDISTILSTLGTPTNVTESKSCMFEGNDKVYTWGDVVVDTYTDGSRDIVYSATLAGTETTPSGIKIGSTVADIEKAYGKTYSVEGDFIVFYFNNDLETLSFKMENNKVVSIEYYVQY